MPRTILLIAMLALLLLPTGPLTTHAQDGDDDERTIAYGETVTGEITNREFEVEYKFEGKADDVIMAIMRRGENADSMESPSIILVDADYTLLADNSGYVTTTLIYELPEDGTYYLLAARRDGRAGESIGAFEMTLLKLIELPLGETVEASSNRDETHFFIVRSEDDFSISYEHLSGTFAPRINVSIINPESGELEDIAAVEGVRLMSGSVNISAAPLDTGTYIVYTSETRGVYFTRDALATFTLTATAYES